MYVLVAQGVFAVVVGLRLCAVVAAEERGAPPSIWCVFQAPAEGGATGPSVVVIIVVVVVVIVVVALLLLLLLLLLFCY